tara:strand:+ start:2833 stop:4707 length:1875 start_codon:yes stop_codon:yes gene_type:complete
MAIFRGTGGAGSANNDVTVTTVTEKASEAAASATAASNSATAAASSASSASSSATTATTKASEASSSKDTATTKASEAATSATNAASSAAAAASSAASIVILDEDDMASNSATAAPSQQSVKAYVDAEVDTADTLAELTDTTITSPADGAMLLYDTGTSKWIDNVMSGDATLADTGAITIANNAIETAMINADAVTNAKIADDSIDSEHYVDGSIDTAHIADDAVTEAKLANAINTAIAANTAKVSNATHTGDVTGATELTIASGAVETGMIADDAVTADKLANSINTDIATGVTANTTANAALSKSGGAMTGAITTNSTFDGRDVATDGTKLDGIEASADVTDTANVTAAGALMDSEVTNLAQVKAFSSADYATAAQGTTADSALQNVSEDSTPQLGGNLDVNGNSIVSASNGDISITPNGTGDVIIDGLKHPQADGTSGQVLQTNGSGQLSFANAGSGKVKQITTGSDATLYAISTTNATSDHAGSIAYSITPTSSSSKIMIHFTIPQVKQSIHAGVRMRVYRQIGGGGYSHVTGLSGTAASNRQAAVFGNYDTNGDGNRAATTMTGTLVDSPATTSQVDYKFYFGTGDGASTVYVNRTQNDTDLNYTHRTRTHCTLVEIET